MVCMLVPPSLSINLVSDLRVKELRFIGALQVASMMGKSLSFRIGRKAKEKFCGDASSPILPGLLIYFLENK